MTRRAYVLSVAAFGNIDCSDKGAPAECDLPGAGRLVGVDVTEDSPTPTSVYRYYDRFGVLIYVGITSRGIRRNREHNDTQPWWRYVVAQEVEHLAHRGAAEKREKQLIREYRPPFNRQHNPGWQEIQEAYLAFATEEKPSHSSGDGLSRGGKKKRKRPNIPGHLTVLPLRVRAEGAGPWFITDATAATYMDRLVIRLPFEFKTRSGHKVGTVINKRWSGPRLELQVAGGGYQARCEAELVARRGPRPNDLTIDYMLLCPSPAKKASPKKAQPHAA